MTAARFWNEDYGQFPLLPGDFDSPEMPAALRFLRPCVRLQRLMQPKIHMSAIPSPQAALNGLREPMSVGQCNYSCSVGLLDCSKGKCKAWRGYRTEEMNFRVGLTLNDSALVQAVWPSNDVCVCEAHAHTIYPVLLASADFQDWWVGGPR